MIVRRVGSALILAVLVGIAALGGCRDATGPKPAIASPTSYDATAPDQSEILHEAIARADAGTRMFTVFDGKPDHQAAEEAGTTVDHELNIIPTLTVRAPGQVISNRAGSGWVVCAAFRCVLHRSDQPADAGLNLD